MEYFAENRKLTKILNDPRLLVKNFGRDRAKRIQARLDEFDAADTLQQIPSDPPPRCHRLHNNLEGNLLLMSAKTSALFLRVTIKPINFRLKNQQL